MKRILRSDWLTKRAQDFSRCSPRKCCLLGHIIKPLFTKLVRSRWLSIGLDSVNKNRQRNLANIQPSWPSAWSIMVQAIPSVPIPPSPGHFSFFSSSSCFFFRKAASAPWWGRAVHPKPPQWSIKSGQIPYPGPTLTLHFPVNKLQMPYLVYRKSVIIWSTRVKHRAQPKSLLAASYTYCRKDLSDLINKVCINDGTINLNFNNTFLILKNSEW